jgi:prepilin-type N-terminal cleavage/methylation domain-containing protein
MSRRLRRISRVGSDQRGFTLIELLIAALIVVIGLMAMMATLDSSRTLVSTAERNEAATHEAEQEMERLFAMPYAELGTATAPGTSTDETHPRYWVQTGNKYRWNQSSASEDENLVFGGSYTMTPNANWTDGEGRLSGEVWRFVTDVYDPNVVQTPTDGADAKRITVAVTIDGDDAPTKPIILSSIVFDRDQPGASP